MSAFSFSSGSGKKFTGKRCAQTMTIAQKFFAVRSLLLAGGTLMSWTTVVRAFQRFYVNESTIFKIQDCITANPVTMPCFYGAIAFAVAFVWALALWSRSSHAGERRLGWLLVAATIFAWVNVAYEFAQYFAIVGGPQIGCSPMVVPPWQTPCFTGAVLFTFSLLVSRAIVSRTSK